MGQRDKGENWENVNSKSTGSGTDGIIFWRWRKKSVWNTGSFNCRYQSKLERFFFFQKTRKGHFLKLCFFLQKIVKPKEFLLKKQREDGGQKGYFFEKSSMGYLCIMSNMNIKTPTN